MDITGGRIQRLETSVVNRIAAGEVIQRPVNAVKELIENSLDAKSTSIQVTVKDGGLKLLQIQDNGTGIMKDDLAIACERFTTSKLSQFEDLNSINTHGFRGEALASISHVAHLTITTKASNSPCGHKASYIDGRLKDQPKPCAGNQGTMITVEDLFYNIPLRKKALRSSAEEHAKIADVVTRYAIHNSGISFTLKKHGDHTADVRTQTGCTRLDNIRTLYGPNVSRELMEFQCEDRKIGVEIEGLVSNANYNSKKTIFLLFINNRLVDCSSLRKALENAYSVYLPKNTHPYIYLSISIDPLNVDVNVHPTKHEVHFLHEDATVELIQRSVDKLLLSSNNSRTYYVQTILPGAACPAEEVVSKSKTSTSSPKTSTPDRVYDRNLVRTDSKEQKLDAFMIKSPSISQPYEKSPRPGTSVNGTAAVDCDKSRTESTESVVEGQEDRLSSALLKGSNDSKRRNITLNSVLNLRKDVENETHIGMRELFVDHTFVGCVDRKFTLIQHRTKLYLINTNKLTTELFYQILLYDFGNHGLFRLSEAASIYELVLIALDMKESGWSEADGSKHDLSTYVVNLLVSKSEMLQDYFSLEIDQAGYLHALPMLLEKYIPSMEGLPMLLLRLATEVNWDREKECFSTLSKELSGFYAVASLLVPKIIRDSEKSVETEEWKTTVEHVIFPALKSMLLPPKSVSEDGTILQVANLPDLYKVFERC